MAAVPKPLPTAAYSDVKHHQPQYYNGYTNQRSKHIPNQMVDVHVKSFRKPQYDNKSHMQSEATKFNPSYQVTTESSEVLVKPVPPQVQQATYWPIQQNAAVIASDTWNLEQRFAEIKINSNNIKSNLNPNTDCFYPASYRFPAKQCTPNMTTYANVPLPRVCNGAMPMFPATYNHVMMVQPTFQPNILYSHAARPPTNYYLPPSNTVHLPNPWIQHAYRPDYTIPNPYIHQNQVHMYPSPGQYLYPNYHDARY